MVEQSSSDDMLSSFEELSGSSASSTIMTRNAIVDAVMEAGRMDMFVDFLRTMSLEEVVRATGVATKNGVGTDELYNAVKAAPKYDLCIVCIAFAHIPIDGPRVLRENFSELFSVTDANALLYTFLRTIKEDNITFLKLLTTHIPGDMFTTESKLPGGHMTILHYAVMDKCSMDMLRLLVSWLPSCVRSYRAKCVRIGYLCNGGTFSGTFTPYRMYMEMASLDIWHTQHMQTEIIEILSPPSSSE